MFLLLLHEGLQELRAEAPNWHHPNKLQLKPRNPTLAAASGFNERAITQPTIIITRTIKQDGYSLVKRSHMWRPFVLLRTQTDTNTGHENS